MNLVNNLNRNLKNLSNLKTHEIVLVVLLVLYLVSNVSTPYNLAPFVNNSYMYLSVVGITVLIFLHSNPLLALFFGIVAMVFLQKSRNVDHMIMQPSVSNKNKKMNDLNNHLKTKTLEEEVIKQSVKLPNNISGPSDYHPVLCDDHNATHI
jgi:hypothetical protein